MEKLIKDTLTQLGLTTKEIRFFWACFCHGPATINDIAKLSHLRRSTAYLLTQELLEKKLITENFHQYKKKITTIDPSDLLRILAAKQRTLGRQEIEIKEHLEELQTIYSTSTVKPKVKVFEGKEGLLTIQKDILTAHKEILLWTNQETERSIFTPEYHAKFIELRKKLGIFIRVLAVNNAKGKLLQKTDQDNLRETKLLPIDVNFSAETYIYDNKIAILDFKKEIFGILIHNESIYSAQKSIFEMVWKDNRK